MSSGTAEGGYTANLFNHLNFPKVEVWARPQPLSPCFFLLYAPVSLFDHHAVRIGPQMHYELALIINNNEKTHVYRLTSADFLRLLSRLTHLSLM